MNKEMSRIRKLPRMGTQCDQIMPVPVMPCCIIADCHPPIPILYPCEALYSCKPCCPPTPLPQHPLQQHPLPQPTPCNCNIINNDSKGFNKKSINEYNPAIECPIGTILIYSGDSAPNGYLICDGKEIIRANYIELFKVIGEQYGKGDGITTFNIPNLLGKIIDTMDGCTNNNNINVINYIIRY